MEHLYNLKAKSLARMRVLILGCGWVGEEFALRAKAAGAQVWASTTTESKMERLKSLGVSAFLADFDRESLAADMPTKFDYVLTSVPSSSKNSVEEVGVRFSRVRARLSGLGYRKHIFLSSTGIYPDMDAVCDEGFELDLNPRLLRSESLMSDLPDTLVYRMGGLFGKERIFAKYFANKVCETGGQLANFVHLDDVVRLIELGFDKLEDGVYNVVCPEHPTKREVIVASAQKYGFDLPLSFDPRDSFQKRVVSDKIVDALGYSFRYSSPLGF